MPILFGMSKCSWYAMKKASKRCFLSHVMMTESTLWKCCKKRKLCQSYVKFPFLCILCACSSQTVWSIKIQKWQNSKWQYKLSEIDQANLLRLPWPLTTWGVKRSVLVYKKLQGLQVKTEILRPQNALKNVLFLVSRDDGTTGDVKHYLYVWPFETGINTFLVQPTSFEAYWDL